MLLADMSEFSLSSPQILPWLLGCALIVGASAFVLSWQHDRKTRALAGALRLVSLVALGVVLMGPIVSARSETVFAPTGTWQLVLPGATPPEGRGPVFKESVSEFVNRVRSALVGETPPAATEVWGADRDSALSARDAVQALGVPCTAHFPQDDSRETRPVLTGISAPRLVRPGEPLRVEFTKAGPPAMLNAYLDGEPLELTDGKAEIRNQTAGTHLLESVLLDEDGVELQRSGHVFRVGEKPTALCIGLARQEFERATSLAPDLNLKQAGVDDFDSADLQLNERAIEMVLLSVDALNRLSADQCFSLASFVARGGGLFVTGDGAKYVAPEYMTADARNLLPVMLQKEGKKPPPDDPPVEEEIVKAEIAKVSICFVLDRSYSMTATIGTSNKTRWNVASTGVVESIRLVELGGKRDAKEKRSESYATRIGVMGFTLQQQWVYEMNNVYPHERNQIEKTLQRMGTELTEIERDDFDAQGYNTDIYAAMRLAIDKMKEERSAVKVIVMMTDGADRDQNTIDGKRHADLRIDAIANDINIITVGIGTEFDGTTPSSRAAKSVIKDLATRNEYVHIASSPATAEKANVIFVDSVELAFEAYDDKKKREDEERKRRLEEQEKNELEPPKVDVLPGVFPLVLGPVGAQLFGKDALPDTAPKVAWVARSKARDGAAVALAAATDDPSATPVLAFQGYGLGRVGFWGAGTDPEALGELTGWGDFPVIFASSLRWLLPREEPDLRLVDEAAPDGIRILDPIKDAEYFLRTPDGDLPLSLNEGRLVGQDPLPLGAGEVIERMPGTETVERSIGDVYVARVPAIDSRQFAVDDASELEPLETRPPEVTVFTREATLPVLYLLTLILLVMPIERLIRRRS